MLVAQACNASYPGGRDKEDSGLKPSQEVVHKPFLQNMQHRKG
jgi:hypothetical protein